MSKFSQFRRDELELERHPKVKQKKLISEHKNCCNRLISLFIQMENDFSVERRNVFVAFNDVLCDLGSSLYCQIYCSRFKNLNYRRYLVKILFGEVGGDKKHFGGYFSPPSKASASFFLNLKQRKITR